MRGRDRRQSALTNRADRRISHAGTVPPVATRDGDSRRWRGVRPRLHGCGDRHAEDVDAGGMIVTGWPPVWSLGRPHSPDGRPPGVAMRPEFRQALAVLADGRGGR